MTISLIWFFGLKALGDAAQQRANHPGQQGLGRQFTSSKSFSTQVLLM